MSQRTKILTHILGYGGWRIVDVFLERPDGTRVQQTGRFDGFPGTPLIFRVERRWMARCENCHAVGAKLHETLPARRWKDLPWAQHPVEIEAMPTRVKCKRCKSSGAELLPWADPYQRQTRRLQQHLALQAASMPVMHVAAQHGLSWGTVRRAEGAALARWDAARDPVPLQQVGVDEKYLGRRNKLDHDFLTIVSNLATGEPIWIGEGRSEATLKLWLDTLTKKKKAGIEVFAMDMHEPFFNAVAMDLDLRHAGIAHDPFHVTKRALKAIDEIRRDTFFRAGTEMRRIGRGSRWLVLRAWEHCTTEQQTELKYLFSHNGQLARAYQIVEELRVALRAPNRDSIDIALKRILRRTQSRRHKHLRKLHESLVYHYQEILSLAQYRPPTGRIEALNNNWETLVRRARGYRDYDYLLLKLKFMTANPIRTDVGVKRFLALDLPAPPQRRAA
jgi:transposase